MAKSKDFNEELIKIRREIVDFHGEMVLLENYSALNYTGALLLTPLLLTLSLHVWSLLEENYLSSYNGSETRKIFP